tara:strand:+ start:839 stop:1786 length:948 start_codon:yes stop_codon:yes gene_type:complete
MKNIIALFILLLSLSSSAKKEEISFLFEDKIDSLISYSSAIQTGNDLSRLLANKKFEDVLRQILNDPTSIHYNFSKIKCLSIIESPRKKKKFRIYTWVMKLGNDDYNYFGFTQYQRSRKKKLKNFVFKLNNKSKEIGKDELSKLDSNNWIGCVYYQIIPPEKRKDKTHILIGWDGNNWRSTKKIIETFSFNNKGEITFGKKIIKYNIGTDKRPKLVSKARLIFEYNGEVSMTVSYNTNLKKIIFDHLMPSDPKLANLYFTYAPDFTYDGLEYEKRKWIHSSDVDVRNQETIDPVRWRPKDVKERTKDTLIPQKSE